MFFLMVSAVVSPISVGGRSVLRRDARDGPFGRDEFSQAVAEQLIDGYAARFAAQVPQRHLHAGFGKKVSPNGRDEFRAQLFDIAIARGAHA